MDPEHVFVTVLPYLPLILGAWTAVTSTVLLVKHTRRVSSRSVWDEGFHVGVEYSLSRLQKLPEILHARGSSHHVHDIEVEVRKVSQAIRNRRKEG